MEKCLLKRVVIILTIVFIGHVTMAQDHPFPTKEQLTGVKAGDVILNSGFLGDYKTDFGTLIVTESEDKNSNKIELPIVRIHSKSQNPAYPVFFFEGGPGGTNIKLDNIPDWLLEDHDIVRVGYRGVDGSVSLNSPEINDFLKNTNNMLSTEGLKLFGGKMSEVVRKFENAGIDLEEYNIINVVNDMEKARKALGYKKIGLSGGSYGGAVAYTYCILYPKSINRALLTEAAFPFDMALVKPSSIDANLNHLNELWKQNPECLVRSKDIVQTIKNVLKTLPQTWNGIIIDPDKIRFTTYFGLYTQNTIAQVFDAFVAAENGDYSGLAFMSFLWNNVVDMFNWGDMGAKTYCTESGKIRDYEMELSSENSIIGSPLSLLAWGPRKYIDWPVKYLPKDFREMRSTDVELLLVYGTKESAESVKRDYLPFFKNGHIVNYENLGHQDVGALQPEASRQLEKMFFLNGSVDTSKFIKTESQQINFVPGQRFQDIAKSMMKQNQ
ncbi:MAG: alpha/beta fold hydrolase [Bacteroidales bacterium]|nr:alpha/beta fold hydrolase [Bacteroidales bacterium]